MLRSTFVSLFQGVLQAKKASTGGDQYQQLADALGKDRAVVSRWFSSDPNWEIDTIADIAAALDLDLTVEARERTTGQRFDVGGSKPISSDVKHRSI